MIGPISDSRSKVISLTSGCDLQALWCNCALVLGATPGGCDFYGYNFSRRYSEPGDVVSSARPRHYNINPIRLLLLLSGHQSSAVQDQQYQLPVEIDPLIGNADTRHREKEAGRAVKSVSRAWNHHSSHFLFFFPLAGGCVRESR